jgi:hypothetical protein
MKGFLNLIICFRHCRSGPHGSGREKKQKTWVLYGWPELTNQFFKTPEFPQNEVRDGKIIENEGGSHLGV